MSVAKIETKFNSETAKKATGDVALGLKQTIHVSIGSRVMLKTNLWTAKGLVNGAFGTVQDICYESASRPPFDQPLAVFVKFDNYTGPTYGNTGCVPIAAVTKYFTEKNVTCIRTSDDTQVSRSYHEPRGY